MIFIPIPPPRKVIQTSCCTRLVLRHVLQTGLGMGMGMNGTAQDCGTSSFRRHAIIGNGGLCPGKTHNHTNIMFINNGSLLMIMITLILLLIIMIIMIIQVIVI